MPFSSRCMRKEDWAEIKHFTPDEFKHPQQMGYEFMLWLDKVRARAAVTMTPSSDYRDPARNKAVGGAEDSSHTDSPCNAIDIRRRPAPGDPNWNHARFRILKAALELGCVRIGMYPNGSLHLDRTEDTRPGMRVWVAVDNPAK